jgi:hypothetical protein
MPLVSPVRLCERGYHGVEAEYLVEWLGPTIYTLEGRGEHQEDDEGKHVFSEARLLWQLEAWTLTAQRLFACDCAERVLPVWAVDVAPGDDRPVQAIAVARRYARGEATEEELAAAGAATEAVAWAARGAARAAAGAAARAAARAAAGAAARAAARAAAGAAERRWQTERLWQYLRGEAR